MLNDKRQMIDENKITFFSTGSSFGLNPQLVEGGKDVADIGSGTKRVVSLQGCSIHAIVAHNVGRTSHDASTRIIITP